MRFNAYGVPRNPRKPRGNYPYINEAQRRDAGRRQDGKKTDAKATTYGI
jgi:hypothetical protein